MQATLDQFAARAVTRLGEGFRCSVMLRRGSRLDQVASNDPGAAACDQVEVREGSGPCVTAIDQLHAVVVDDLDTDTRWPTWNQAARDQGFRSFLALPGYVDETTTVALNAYSARPATWTSHDVVQVDLYVQELAAALHHAST
ncbi:GAF domain-containing protein [Cellulomonas cellasea]|nr:GAF domain-containing protein [Cellulomonas cellasea]GEA86118.1 hypothetical protein CCE01nite_00670 [Cellulomonas cellasea]